MGYPYHSESHTLLNIVRKGYEEDLSLSKQRLEALKDDPECTEIEQRYHDSVLYIMSTLDSAIKWEHGSSSSVQTVVEVGYHNRLGKYVSTGLHKAELREEDKPKSEESVSI